MEMKKSLLGAGAPTDSGDNDSSTTRLRLRRAMGTIRKEVLGVKPVTAFGRNGEFLGKAHGLPFYLSDVYYVLLRVRLVVLVASVAVLFLLVSLGFAGLYAIHPEGLNPDPVDFRDILFHSIAVTLDIDSPFEVEVDRAKEGYSTTTWCVYIAHGLFKMICVAGLVGLILDRLQRTEHRLAFSSKVVVTMKNGKKMMTFRVASERTVALMDARVDVFASGMINKELGLMGMIPLKLTHPEKPFFSLSWQLVHEMTPDSPLVKDDAEWLGDPSSMLWVKFSGEDTTADKTFHVLHCYSISDFVFNEEFENVISQEANGTPVFDYNKFQLTKPTTSKNQL